MSEPFEDEHPPHADASQLAADALRLIGSAQDWARQTFADADGTAHADGHTGPECQWCPLCQFVAVLRGERPELTERVAEVGTALLTVLRSAFEAAAKPPSDAPEPRVQRIDLGGDERSGAGPE